jgi:hypothetical protein
VEIVPEVPGYRAVLPGLSSPPCVSLVTVPKTCKKRIFVRFAVFLQECAKTKTHSFLQFRFAKSDKNEQKVVGTRGTRTTQAYLLAQTKSV